MVVSRLTQHPEGLFDSRRLTFLTALVHPMAVEGAFICRISALPLPPGTTPDAEAAGAVVADLAVRVTADSSEVQVSIDLADLASSGPGVELMPGGYLLFHFSDEAGAFSIAMLHVDEAGAEVEDYSSTLLQPGDVFALILLEEGTFSLANLANGTSAVINVLVPPVKSRIIDAYETVAGAGGFTPPTVDIDLGGTLSITVDVADTILVTRPPGHEAPTPQRPTR